MAVKTLFIDPSRCIGCRACEAACRECDSHKGESMVMVDFIDRGYSVATQPTVCMHCEAPTAPCAQVCPVMAIQITPDDVVQSADASRCIACRNCVYACPFGVPKLDVGARLMKKCNLCYDRTSQDLKPWCAQACPTQAIWYGSYEEFVQERRGVPINLTAFGAQEVRTQVYHVLPESVPKLDVSGLLAEGIVTLSQEQSSGRTKPGKKVQDVISAAALGCQLDPRDLVPNPESLRTFLSVVVRLEPMAAWTKVLANWAKCGEEALSMAS